MTEARNAGVSGTPAFLINEELLSGTHEYSVFVNYIEEAL